MNCNQVSLSTASWLYRQKQSYPSMSDKHMITEQVLHRDIQVVSVQSNETYCCRVLGQLGRLSCEHMNGLQTRQTWWFGLQGPECFWWATILWLLLYEGQQHASFETGLSDRCLIGRTTYGRNCEKRRRVNKERAARCFGDGAGRAALEHCPLHVSGASTNSVSDTTILLSESTFLLQQPLIALP